MLSVSEYHSQDTPQLTETSGAQGMSRSFASSHIHTPAAKGQGGCEWTGRGRGVCDNDSKGWALDSPIMHC